MDTKRNASYIECTRCKNLNCLLDFYPDTEEEYKICKDCGYRRIVGLERDVDGNLIKIDSSKGYERENLKPYSVHIKEPYGAWHVTFVDGRTSFGTLKAEEDYKNFVLVSRNTNQSGIVASAMVSRLVGGAIEREFVVDNHMHQN